MAFLRQHARKPFAKQKTHETFFQNDPFYWKIHSFQSLSMRIYLLVQFCLSMCVFYFQTMKPWTHGSGISSKTASKSDVQRYAQVYTNPHFFTSCIYLRYFFFRYFTESKNKFTGPFHAKVF